MAQGSGRPGGHSGSNNSEIPELFGADPSVSPGLPRPVGWRVALADGSAAWDKFGAADTDWSPVGVPASGVVDSVSTTDPLLSVAPTTGAVLIAQRLGATWGTVGTVGYFACDTVAGNDADAGFSTVSQAEAGLVAVKTIAKLLSIIPRFGYGRSFRAAIRAGNYASDATPDFSGFIGYTKMLVIGTDTVASAGAVAFAGDGNDTICAGMTTATGMHAAGYNPTAYAVAPDGTPTITLQLAGGGAPAFPAAPARPYLCRLRFDVATHTAALRNFADSILLVPSGGGGAQLILGNPIPGGAFDPTDLCYIEMPNVTGPAKVTISQSGGASQMQFCGINGGIWSSSLSNVRFAGCEGSFVSQESIVVIAGSISGVPSTTRIVGTGLRSDGTQLFGGTATMTDWGDTGLIEPTLFQGVEQMELERWSAPGMVVYGGAHAIGNNIPETIGTNSSTAHGATCQIWAPQTTTQGVAASGLAVYGGYQLGRIKFSNMGANPCARINGVGLGVSVQGISGGLADGNLDVGLDLSPSGISGNTVGGTGCEVLVGPGSLPSATGTNGDVRLSDGTIVTWATARAGLLDVNGNQMFGAGNAPTHPTPVAAGAVAVTITNAPAGSPAAPARYVKFPDGAGGFYTFPSLT